MKTPTSRFVLTCLTGVALVLATAAAGLAQNGNQNRQNVRGDGTIKGLAGPGVLEVVGGSGEQWQLKLPERPDQITYNASADLEWLQSGMFVEFSGTFDGKGQAVSPVGQLEVFTPSRDRLPGIQADAAGNNPVKDLFQSADPAEKPKAKPKPEEQLTALRIAGQLVSLRDGKIIVSAGTARVTAELAEKCDVTVSVHDVRLVRTGDTVRFNGWAMPGAQQNVWGTQVTINAKEPLSAKPAAAAPNTTAAKPAPKPTPPATLTLPPTQEQQAAALADLENPAAGDKPKK